MKCVVKNCVNRDSFKSIRQQAVEARIGVITYHTFPTIEEIRQKWISFVSEKLWKPISDSYICSQHFEKNCFDDFKSPDRKIHPYSIPTIPVQLIEYMVYQCYVPGCKNNYRTQNVQLIPFPQEGTKTLEFQKWVENIMNFNGATEEHIGKLTSQSKLCSEHFEKKCYAIVNGKSFLRSKSVPTLFLPGKPLHQNPFEENDEIDIENSIVINKVPKCAISSCNSSFTDPQKAFFPFPTDLSLNLIWTEAVKSHNKNNNFEYLCSDHFEDDDFEPHTKKKFLKYGSVPSMFPPLPIESLEDPLEDDDPLSFLTEFDDKTKSAGTDSKTEVDVNKTVETDSKSIEKDKQIKKSTKTKVKKINPLKRQSKNNLRDEPPKKTIALEKIDVKNKKTSLDTDLKGKILTPISKDKIPSNIKKIIASKNKKKRESNKNATNPPTAKKTDNNFHCSSSKNSKKPSKLALKSSLLKTALETTLPKSIITTRSSSRKFARPTLTKSTPTKSVFSKSTARKLACSKSTPKRTVSMKPGLVKSTPKQNVTMKPKLTKSTPTSPVTVKPELTKSTLTSTVTVKPELTKSTPTSTVTVKPELTKSTPTPTVTMKPELIKSTPTQTAAIKAESKKCTPTKPERTLEKVLLPTSPQSNALSTRSAAIRTKSKIEERKEFIFDKYYVKLPKEQFVTIAADDSTKNIKSNKKKVEDWLNEINDNNISSTNTSNKINKNHTEPLEIKPCKQKESIKKEITEPFNLIDNSNKTQEDIKTNILIKPCQVQISKHDQCITNKKNDKKNKRKKSVDSDSKPSKIHQNIQDIKHAELIEDIYKKFRPIQPAVPRKKMKGTIKIKRTFIIPLNINANFTPIETNGKTSAVKTETINTNLPDLVPIKTNREVPPLVLIKTNNNKLPAIVPQKIDSPKKQKKSESNIVFDILNTDSTFDTIEVDSFDEVSLIMDDIEDPLKEEQDDPLAVDDPPKEDVLDHFEDLESLIKIESPSPQLLSEEEHSLLVPFYEEPIIEGKRIYKKSPIKRPDRMLKKRCREWLNGYGMETFSREMESNEMRRNVQKTYNEERFDEGTNNERLYTDERLEILNMDERLNMKMTPDINLSQKNTEPIASPTQFVINYFIENKYVPKRGHSIVTRQKTKKINTIDPFITKNKLKKKYDYKITSMVPKIILKDIFRDRRPVLEGIKIKVHATPHRMINKDFFTINNKSLTNENKSRDKKNKSFERKPMMDHGNNMRSVVNNRKSVGNDGKSFENSVGESVGSGRRSVGRKKKSVENERKIIKNERKSLGNLRSGNENVNEKRSARNENKSQTKRGRKRKKKNGNKKNSVKNEKSLKTENKTFRNRKKSIGSEQENESTEIDVESMTNNISETTEIKSISSKNEKSTNKRKSTLEVIEDFEPKSNLKLEIISEVDNILNGNQNKQNIDFLLNSRQNLTFSLSENDSPSKKFVPSIIRRKFKSLNKTENDESIRNENLCDLKISKVYSIVDNDLSGNENDSTFETSNVEINENDEMIGNEILNVQRTEDSEMIGNGNDLIAEIKMIRETNRNNLKTAASNVQNTDTIRIKNTEDSTTETSNLKNAENIVLITKENENDSSTEIPKINDNENIELIGKDNENDSITETSNLKNIENNEMIRKENDLTTENSGMIGKENENNEAFREENEDNEMIRKEKEKNETFRKENDATTEASNVEITEPIAKENENSSAEISNIEKKSSIEKELSGAAIIENKAADIKNPDENLPTLKTNPIGESNHSEKCNIEKLNFQADLQKYAMPRKYKIKFISDDSNKSNELVLDSTTDTKLKILGNRTADIDRIKNQLNKISEKNGNIKVVKIIKNSKGEIIRLLESEDQTRNRKLMMGKKIKNYKFVKTLNNKGNVSIPKVNKIDKNLQKELIDKFRKIYYKDNKNVGNSNQDVRSKDKSNKNVKGKDESNQEIEDIASNEPIKNDFRNDIIKRVSEMRESNSDLVINPLEKPSNIIDPDLKIKNVSKTYERKKPNKVFPKTIKMDISKYSKYKFMSFNNPNCKPKFRISRNINIKCENKIRDKIILSPMKNYHSIKPDEKINQSSPVKKIEEPSYEHLEKPNTKTKLMSYEAIVNEIFGDDSNNDNFTIESFIKDTVKTQNEASQIKKAEDTINQSNTSSVSNLDEKEVQSDDECFDVEYLESDAEDDVNTSKIDNTTKDNTQTINEKMTLDQVPVDNTESVAIIKDENTTYKLSFKNSESVLDEIKNNLDNTEDLSNTIKLNGNDVVYINNLEMNENQLYCVQEDGSLLLLPQYSLVQNENLISQENTNSTQSFQIQTSSTTPTKISSKPIVYIKRVNKNQTEKKSNTDEKTSNITDKLESTQNETVLSNSSPNKNIVIKNVSILKEDEKIPIPKTILTGLGNKETCKADQIDLVYKSLENPSGNTE